eukprot:CAMPEP_0173450352 /NCGR_PEP_ID=MMETSP1357-20121228/44551_1 /TAXON_ID=77926 /ORGANISM="Hemiselmis rufescens, Strain PCC563" /LENGTH=136 /DNA_ID=CAMNT_0014417025 /DNA_START=68 /DNA_END=474 /DNA_ORIENTATION=-
MTSQAPNAILQCFPLPTACQRREVHYMGVVVSILPMRFILPPPSDSLSSIAAPKAGSRGAVRCLSDSQYRTNLSIAVCVLFSLIHSVCAPLPASPSFILVGLTTILNPFFALASEGSSDALQCLCMSSISLRMYCL